MSITWYERDSDGDYWTLSMDQDRCISGRALAHHGADAAHRAAAARDHYQPGTNEDMGLRFAVISSGNLDPLAPYRHVSPAEPSPAATAPTAAVPWWRRLLPQRS